MVVDERENIAPGFSQTLTVKLQPGEFDITCDGFDKTLFCDNDTNQQRCFGTPNPKGLHPKDTFHDAVVHGRFASLPPLWKSR